MSNLFFEVKRDSENKGLRKVHVELWLDSDPNDPEAKLELIDRTRMAAGIPFLGIIMTLLWLSFPRRLERRKNVMLDRAAKMLKASTAHEIPDEAVA